MGWQMFPLSMDENFVSRLKHIPADKDNVKGESHISSCTACLFFKLDIQ